MKMLLLWIISAYGSFIAAVLRLIVLVITAVGVAVYWVGLCCYDKLKPHDIRDRYKK